jgi:hypothetical protein
VAYSRILFEAGRGPGDLVVELRSFPSLCSLDPSLAIAVLNTSNGAIFCEHQSEHT